jgi:chitodextrinase
MKTTNVRFKPLVIVLVAANVLAACGGGAATTSIPTQPTTFPTDTTAPSIPTGLTANAVSSSQVNLSWTASTDNVGVVGYIVYRNGTQQAITGNTSYQDAGLAASTSYSYRVAAYDAAGNTSAKTGATSATTQSGTSIVNGVCGSANGMALSAAPTANLCSVGTATSVTGTGPWAWSCTGANGGTTASCSATLASTPTSISNMTPGTWMAVPNSHLPVYNGPLAAAIHGNSGPSGIMDAWNGAAFDTSTNRLIVWGGGHQDYYGNEVYAFSLNTLSWSALSLPSDPGSSCSSANNGCTGPTFADGQPIAVHTYDTPTYVPALHAVYSMAGGSNTGYGDYWLFGLTENKWTTNIVAPGFASAGSSNVTDYDSVTGHIFGMPYGPFGGQVSAGLYEYDPLAGTNAYTQHGTEDVPDYHMTAAIDPVHRYFVAVGGGFLRAYSLSSGNVVQSTSSGNQAIVNGNAPGFVWDSAVGKFVGWNGGSTVYLLDPTTWSWTPIPAVSGSATPTAPNSQGTFGRFKYSPSFNVFVGVNRVDENVYIYKPNF